MRVCVLYVYGFILYAFFVSARVAVNFFNVYVITLIWLHMLYIFNQQPPGCLLCFAGAALM